MFNNKQQSTDKNTFDFYLTHAQNNCTIQKFRSIPEYTQHITQMRVGLPGLTLIMLSANYVSILVKANVTGIREGRIQAVSVR